MSCRPVKSNWTNVCVTACRTRKFDWLMSWTVPSQGSGAAPVVVTAIAITARHVLLHGCCPLYFYGVERGRGVGRGLGVGEGLGVAVGVAVGVARGVGVGVGVGVIVGVGVGVAVCV